MKIKFLAIGMCFLTLAIYQNCNPARYGFEGGALVEKSEDVTPQATATPSASPDPSASPQPNPSPTASPTSSPSPSSTPLPSGSPTPTPTPTATGTPVVQQPTPSPTPCKPHHRHKDEEEGVYVCVLEGHGRSIKLGYVEGELTGKVATPQDVCLSKNACLNIVSQAFEVKSAEKRGFCPNKNPHVVHFSDEEIQALIDKIKSTNNKNK